MKGRILFFDIARALCVLWIVGVWHIPQYLHSEEINENIDKFGLVTYSVLACFTFISGFFLGKKKLSPIQFYKNRLKRLFVPLLLSSVILLSFFGWYDSFTNFIFSVTGLACFIGPMPRTLWYFSMLIIFYILTPMLLYKAEGKPVAIIARALVVYMIYCILYKIGFCDKRILLYFPFYVAGMCLTMSNVISLVTNKVYNVVCICIMALIICITGDYESGVKSYWELILLGGKILLGTYLLLTAAYYMEKCLHPKLNHFFSLVAYASMFAYLFHREGYGIILLYEEVTSSQLPNIVVPIMTVCIFVVSYLMQYLYDNLLKKMQAASASKSFRSQKNE